MRKKLFKYRYLIIAVSVLVTIGGIVLLVRLQGGEKSPIATDNPPPPKYTLPTKSPTSEEVKIMGSQELSEQARLKTPFKMSLKELSDEATVIAIGKAETVRSQWNEDQTQIYTYTTFTTNNFIKGKGSSKTLTIKQLGGQVGNTRLLIVGAPEFKRNENSLLFLKPREVDDTTGKTRNYLVVDRAQGKFNIAKDPVSGKDMVTNEEFLGKGKAANIEDFVSEVKENI